MLCFLLIVWTNLGTIAHFYQYKRQDTVEYQFNYTIIAAAILGPLLFLVK